MVAVHENDGELGTIYLDLFPRSAFMLQYATHYTNVLAGQAESMKLNQRAD